MSNRRDKPSSDPFKGSYRLLLLCLAAASVAVKSAGSILGYFAFTLAIVLGLLCLAYIGLSILATYRPHHHLVDRTISLLLHPLSRFWRKTVRYFFTIGFPATAIISGTHVALVVSSPIPAAHPELVDFSLPTFLITGTALLLAFAYNSVCETLRGARLAALEPSLHKATAELFDTPSGASQAETREAVAKYLTATRRAIATLHGLRSSSTTRTLAIVLYAPSLKRDACVPLAWADPELGGRELQAEYDQALCRVELPLFSLVHDSGPLGHAVIPGSTAAFTAFSRTETQDLHPEVFRQNYYRYCVVYFRQFLALIPVHLQKYFPRTSYLRTAIAPAAWKPTNGAASPARKRGQQYALSLLAYHGRRSFFTDWDRRLFADAARNLELFLERRSIIAAENAIPPLAMSILSSSMRVAPRSVSAFTVDETRHWVDLRGRKRNAAKFAKWKTLSEWSDSLDSAKPKAYAVRKAGDSNTVGLEIACAIPGTSVPRLMANIAELVPGGVVAADIQLLRTCLQHLRDLYRDFFIDGEKKLLLISLEWMTLGDTESMSIIFDQLAPWESRFDLVVQLPAAPARLPMDLKTAGGIRPAYIAAIERVRQHPGVTGICLSGADGEHELNLARMAHANWVKASSAAVAMPQYVTWLHLPSGGNNEPRVTNVVAIGDGNSDLAPPVTHTQAPVVMHFNQ